MDFKLKKVMSFLIAAMLLLCQSVYFDLEAFADANVYEVEGSNLTQNGISRATASISDDAWGTTADKAIDGKYSNWTQQWCSGGNTSEKWLQVDLGKNYLINRYVLRHAEPYEPGRGVVKNFKIQSSYDGQSWKDVDAVSNNGNGITDKVISTFAARYVRVYILNPAGGNICERIYEFELYYHSKYANQNALVVEGSNLTQNGIAKATASVSDDVWGTTPDKAIDGKYSGWTEQWCSGGNTTAKWLKVDLGKNYLINRYILRHAEPYEPGRGVMRNFKIQKSLDGQNWVDVDVVVDNIEGVNDKVLSTFAARYVRIDIQIPPNSATCERIYEFELYYHSKYNIDNDNSNYKKYIYNYGNKVNAKYVNPNVNIAQKYMSVTSSKNVSSNYQLPYMAVNGTVSDIGDKWCSGYGGGKNQWLMLDLGSYYYIDRWKVVNGKEFDSRMFTKNYKLQYKDENGKWVDASGVYNNTNGSTDIVLNGQIITRFVRLYVVEGDFDDATRIHEFQLYNSKGYVPMPGDVLLTTEAGGPAYQHAGIVKDSKNTIEADGSGINDSCDIEKWTNPSRTYGANIRVMRIKSSSYDNAIAARDYAMRQIGKSYLIPNPFSYKGYDREDKFYCTSLAHFSWRSIGYSLDSTYEYGILTVGDLHSDPDTYDVYENGKFDPSAINTFSKLWDDTCEYIIEKGEYIVAKTKDGIEYIYKKTTDALMYVGRKVNGVIECVGDATYEVINTVTTQAAQTYVNSIKNIIPPTIIPDDEDDGWDILKWFGW
jgi:post-segregation antitoxin (ccd killing protein)